MSSLFDRLQDELGDQDEKGGITPLDLLDLPEDLRRIMRFMLKAVVISRGKINEEIQKWDEKNRMSDSDLSESLRALTQQGWLIKLGEEDNPNYRVNLRRKKASKLDSSIWGALDDKINQRIEEQKKKKDDEGGEEE